MRRRWTRVRRRRGSEAHDGTILWTVAAWVALAVKVTQEAAAVAEAAVPAVPSSLRSATSPYSSTDDSS